MQSMPACERVALRTIMGATPGVSGAGSFSMQATPVKPLVPAGAISYF